MSRKEKKADAGKEKIMRKERKIVEEMAKKKHAYYGVTTARWKNWSEGEPVPPNRRHISATYGYWEYSLGGTNAYWIRQSMTLKEIREVIDGYRECLEWSLPKENLYLIAGDEMIANHDGTVYIADAVLARVL